MSDAARPSAATETTAAFADTWVVLPTYDESQNLPRIAEAILGSLPGAHLLVEL